jgi:hypothetical protein
MQQEDEAFDRALEGVYQRLDVAHLIGENETLHDRIYETVMRLPDEVRTFVFDMVIFLSGAWGQAVRGADWSQRWLILLAPDLPDADVLSVIVHAIAYAWRGHGQQRGITPEEEREACDLVRHWGFTGEGTVFVESEGSQTFFIN